jgi:hypothetical protein
MGFDIPVMPLELPAYTRKENWGASETFFAAGARLLRGRPVPGARAEGAPANLLGPTALGFRCRDDITEVTKLLDALPASRSTWSPRPAPRRGPAAHPGGRLQRLPLSRRSPTTPAPGWSGCSSSRG